VLLVSEGGERAHVQRRNPHTGALIASSGEFEGVTSPHIGGIIDGGAWISESGGNGGYAQRLAIDTLKPTSIATYQPATLGPLAIFGSNAIAAWVIDGIVWVTKPPGGVGGPRRDYCADPVTGRERASVGLPRYGSLLTADPGSIYYVPDANLPKNQELVRAPIDPRCRSDTVDVR
jgi:hypothetical protein